MSASDLRSGSGREAGREAGAKAAAFRTSDS